VLDPLSLLIFTPQYAKKYAENPGEIETQLNRIKKYCQVVRVIAHTQVMIAPVCNLSNECFSHGIDGDF